jgi:multidrug efflux system membrane fusion protein
MHGVTLIPTAAVQLSTATTTGAYVYLVKPDSTVTVRDITTGITEGDQSQVLSGLQPGDEIVLTGVDKLNEGSKVTVQLQGAGGGRGGNGAAEGAARGAAPPAGSSGLTNGSAPNSLPKSNSGRPVRDGGKNK